MTMKNIVIAVVAVVALIGGSFLFLKPTITEDGNIQVGASSGAAIVGNCQTINDNITCFERQVMKNASTTCSFRAPTNASSTLIFAGATYTSTNGSSFDVEWGKDKTSAFATTTSLGYKPGAISSGDTGTFTASSSGATIEDQSTIFAPGAFLNFKTGSSTPANLKGTCSAIFQLI